MSTEKTIKDIELPMIALNKSQDDLFKELQNRSKSCSKMYSDILKLISIDFLDTKSHLVGHLMRELDSEIRKSLEYKEPDSLTEEQAKEFDLPFNPEKPNQYQWESLSDEQAKKIILPYVKKYQNKKEIEEIEKQKQEIIKWEKEK